MPSFGEKLRQEREKRGIGLSEVASATNVGRHLLEALEANDFQKLPGGPFNKGFVRAYARHIGIDPEAAVASYTKEERGMGMSTPDVEREMPAAEVRYFELRDEGDRTTLLLDWKLVKWSLLSASVTLLFLLSLWFLWPGNEAATPLSAMDSPVQAADTDNQPAAPVQADSPALQPEQTPAPPAEQTGLGTAPLIPVNNQVVTPKENAEDEPPAAMSQQVQEQAGGDLPADDPETTPAGSPEVADPDEDMELTVIDSGVGTGIANRMLVGRGDRFTTGTQLWFWTRTTGGREGTRINHVWLLNGRQAASYARTLGGPHWRNNSRKTMSGQDAGDWAVEVRDRSGRVLARSTFTVVPR